VAEVTSGCTAGHSCPVGPRAEPRSHRCGSGITQRRSRVVCHAHEADLEPVVLRPPKMRPGQPLSMARSSASPTGRTRDPTQRLSPTTSMPTINALTALPPSSPRCRSPRLRDIAHPRSRLLSTRRSQHRDSLRCLPRHRDVSGRSRGSGVLTAAPAESVRRSTACFWRRLGLAGGIVNRRPPDPNSVPTIADRRGLLEVNRGTR
jgi:hypothetical protein